jgi:hypothetical protein
LKGDAIDDAISFMEDKTAETIEHMNTVKRGEQQRKQLQQQKQQRQQQEQEEMSMIKQSFEESMEEEACRLEEIPINPKKAIAQRTTTTTVL